MLCDNDDLETEFTIGLHVGLMCPLHVNSIVTHDIVEIGSRSSYKSCISVMEVIPEIGSNFDQLYDRTI